MKGPNAAELLVEEVQKRVRLEYRIRELAYKCQDIQELREKLEDVLSKKTG